MNEELRQLHLRGALGAVRIEQYDGREHLVVPVVALMDGVIHAVNAATPERVTAATLARAAHSWNGRPLVLGHPVKNGRQCSANEPAIEASHRFGTIFNSRMAGSKLLMDAYVDLVRAEKLGGAEFVRRLRDGEQCEVSVGAFVTTDSEAGSHNGKAYKATWLETVGDHLAFLPKGTGACSIEMGCGAHRAAMHMVTAEGIEMKTSLKDRILALFENDEPTVEDDDVVQLETLAQAFKALVGKEISAKNASVIQAAHDSTHAMHDQATALGAKCDREWKWLAKHKECEACRGLGQIKTGDTQADCDACGGMGYRAAGAPDGHPFYGNQWTDGQGGGGPERRIGNMPTSSVGGSVQNSDGRTLTPEGMQNLKEHLDSEGFRNTTSLRATVDAPEEYRHDSDGTRVFITKKTNGGKKTYHPRVIGGQFEERRIRTAASLISATEPELKAACRCNNTEADMDRTQRIAALVKNEHNPIKDMKVLEASSDGVLDIFETQATRCAEMKAASDKAVADKKTADEAEAKKTEDLKAAQARADTAEAKLRAAEANQVTDEMRALVADKKAADAKQKAELVTTLKAAQKAFTAEELDAKPIGELIKLAQMVKVETSDYSGRGLARTPGADKVDYTPPDPYEKGIKALQGVN